MDCFLGQLLLVPYTFAPQGWMFCEGQLLNIAEYNALYALLGAAYGGDGQTTFALPDLRGRVPIGMGTSAQFGTSYFLGQQGGCEQVALDPNTLPAHSHAFRAAAGAGTAHSPANAALAGATVYAAGTSTVSAMAPACTPAGQSQPHNNMGPYLPMRWIIAVDGIFPTQS